MFTEAKLIYDIAKDFFSHRDTMRKAQADARQRAADYFAELARVLEETSASLSVPVYPSGQCAQILVHANAMPAALKGVVDATDIAGLQSRLIGAHRIEGLYSDISNAPPDALLDRLSKLNETSGIFRAMAATLRVS